MREHISHRVNVRDKLGFLRRLMVEYAHGGRMSLEGDLTKCHFLDDLLMGREEGGYSEETPSTRDKISSCYAWSRIPSIPSSNRWPRQDLPAPSSTFRSSKAARFS